MVPVGAQEVLIILGVVLATFVLAFIFRIFRGRRDRDL